MALSEATLADELAEALDATADGAAGPAQLAQAYAAYFGGARLNGLTPIAGGVTTARDAMAGAMAFTSGLSRAQGAAQLAAGVAAFWSTVTGAAASIFTGATTASPPPGLGTLATALISAFASNMAAETRAEAAANLAAAIHAASTGATGVIPPTTYPIL